jgi:predicted peptidase
MRQKAYRFEVAGTKHALDYLLFLPAGHGRDPARRWPLVLFLHGSGERGGDPALLLRHGIPRHVERHPGFPFVAVSPQCPGGTSWEWQMETLPLLLDHAVGTYRADPARVYLTGISMGGAGAWTLGVLRPEAFAAVVPICGYGPRSLGFPRRVRALRDVPVWAFHGARDRVVPPRESEVLVEELEEAGGNACLTIYPDADHDSWTRTYADPALYAWLLAQARQA